VVCEPFFRLGTPEKVYGKEKRAGKKERKADLCLFPILKELTFNAKFGCFCISPFSPY